VLLIDVEETCDRCGGLDAHASGMVVSRSLARAARLNVTLGNPRPMEENDNLMILHTVILLVVEISVGLA
jgi:hypothetical protein